MYVDRKKGYAYVEEEGMVRVREKERNLARTWMGKECCAYVDREEILVLIIVALGVFVTSISMSLMCILFLKNCLRSLPAAQTNCLSFFLGVLLLL